MTAASASPVPLAPTDTDMAALMLLEMSDAVSSTSASSAPSLSLKSSTATSCRSTSDSIVIDSASPLTEDPDPPSDDLGDRDTGSSVLSGGAPRAQSDEQLLSSAAATAQMQSTKRCCATCGAPFATLAQLRAHTAVHKKTYACKIDGCTLSFPRRLELKHHRALAHKEITSDKPFPCPICPTRYRTLPELRSHSLVHSTARPHACDVCQATFKRVAELRLHAMTHTGERPHACPYAATPVACTKRFKTAREATVHAVVHSDRKPFACRARGCRAAFKRRQELRVHAAAMGHELAGDAATSDDDNDNDDGPDAQSNADADDDGRDSSTADGSQYRGLGRTRAKRQKL
ncbi:hypothetical protein HDU83_008834 [Entophlyctis luteolus]|nr:hypothetical protein HDU83_008834 [Entophlyctis luteolus]